MLAPEDVPVVTVSAKLAKNPALGAAVPTLEVSMPKKPPTDHVFPILRVVK